MHLLYFANKEVNAMQELPQGRKQRIRTIVGLIFLAFFLYRIDLFYGLLTSFLGIITAFIVGLLIALLINIPLQAMERVLPFPETHPVFGKVRRAVCLGISVLLVAALIAFLALVIIPEVVTAVERLIARLPDLIAQLEQWLLGYQINLRQLIGLGPTDEATVRDAVDRINSFLIGGISYGSNMVVSAAQVLINLIIGFIFAIYLLYSKERIKGQIKSVLDAFLPAKHAKNIQRVLSMTIHSYSRFLGGQVLQALVSALIIWLVMLVLGLPYAVLIALITIVCAFIPIFGPYIAGVLGTLLVFTAEPDRALWFLLIYLVTQQLEGSLIYPRILSNAVDIPSIWVLVAVTVGGGIMGIAGMLLFVPLAAVGYRLLGDATKRRMALKEVGARG